MHIYTYILYIYTHRSEEAKRKQSEQRRLQRKRSQKILDENAAYGPPDKGHNFDNEITPAPCQKKKKSCSAKKLPLQSKGQNGQDKTPAVGATVKAKYDSEWFIGEIVAYNEEIDQWTIYFKEDDYTDYVIFPDDDIIIQ